MKSSPGSPPVQASTQALEKAPSTMLAAVRRRYGDPSEISVEEVEVPRIGQNEVLVRVSCVSLNASDWEGLTGRPAYVRVFGLFRPRKAVLGSDVVGIVVAAGQKVTRFRVGDRVMGDTMGVFGCLAQYVKIPHEMLMPAPPELSDEQVAALPQAGAIAWTGIVEQKVTAGQNVLINGGGGGSGTLAIQLAKRAGAHVTAVDNEEKLSLMERLGADVVVDYRKDDVAQVARRYDLVLDLVATRSVFQSASLLSPRGKYWLVGGTMKSLLQVVFLGAFWGLATGKKLGVLSVPPNLLQAYWVAELVQRGEIEVVVDKAFPLSEIREALSHHGGGHALGKVLVVPS